MKKQATRHYRVLIEPNGFVGSFLVTVDGRIDATGLTLEGAEARAEQVARDLSMPSNRAYWRRVDRLAKQVEAYPAWMRPAPPSDPEKER